MDLTKLTATNFKRIARLLEEKESLQQRISDIDHALGGGDSSGPAAAAPAKARKTRVVAAGGGKRQKRGQLKESIVALLKGAGKGGLAVKDIAAKLKVKPVNVHTWFATTGKKISEIRNIDGKRVWGR